MASLTDTLSGPSGGKPIINTERQALDVFGTVANFGAAVINGAPKPPDPKDVQAATDDAALNMFVGGVEDILSGKIPPEVRDHAGKISKMKRAGISPVHIDAAIQGLMKRVASKYPASKNQYYKWLNDQGLDDFVFQEAKRTLELQETEQKAEDTAFAANYEKLNKLGYSTEQMSPYQINKTAQNHYIEEANLAESKRLFDLKVAEQNYNASVASENRAAANYNTAESARELTESQTAYVNDLRSTIATQLNPTVIELNKRTQGALSGEIPEPEYRASLTQTLQQLQSDKVQAVASVTGITKENRQAIEEQFDLYITFTQSLLDGDLSVNKARLRNLEAWQSGVKLRAIDKAPIFMMMEEIAGPSGVDWLLQGANQTPGMIDAQSKGAIQLGSLFGDIAASATTEQPLISKMLDAFRSVLPSDTSNLEGVIPETYNSTVRLAAGSLPSNRRLLTNEPTKENATYFQRSFSSIVPELNKIATASSSEKQVAAILKTIPAQETLGAIAAYEKASGDTIEAKKMRKTVSNAYGRALNAAYMDYTSNSIGSILSPMKTSGGTGRGPVFGTVVPKITYNEETGMFQHNGAEIANLWTGTTSKKTVTKLNQLLDGAIASERALGSLPANMSDLGARAFLVKGLAGKAKWDQSVQDYIDESGYVAVSPGEILVEQQAKEEEAAKAVKKTEAPAAKAEPAKAVVPQLNPLDAYLQNGLGDLPDFKMSGGSRSTYVAPTSAELKARMEADPIVAQVLAEVDRTESGGSYTKLYNNSETSEFSNVKITEKTVDELLEFTDLSGDYGQYVKNTRPDKKLGVSTPLGRYQIVGKTLKDLKEQMGLTGDEVFTPELQDQMFLFLLDRRLRAGQNLADEWQGFKGGPLDKEN